MTENNHSVKYEEIKVQIITQYLNVTRFINEQKELNTHKEQIINFVLMDFRFISVNSTNLIRYARDNNSISYDESIQLYEFIDEQIRSIYDELQKI